MLVMHEAAQSGVDVAIEMEEPGRSDAVYRGRARASDALAGIVAALIALAVSLAAFVFTGGAVIAVEPFIIIVVGGFVGMECAAAVRRLLRCPAPLAVGPSTWRWGFGLLVAALDMAAVGVVTQTNAVVEGIVVVVAGALIGLVDARYLRKYTATPRAVQSVKPPSG